MKVSRSVLHCWEFAEMQAAVRIEWQGGVEVTGLSRRLQWHRNVDFFKHFVDEISKIKTQGGRPRTSTSVEINTGKYGGASMDSRRRDRLGTRPALMTAW